MAMRLDIICAKCNKPSVVYESRGKPAPTLCDECVAKAEREKRKAFIAQYTALPHDEAIAQLAGKLYDLRQKVEVMERVTCMFTPIG